MTTAPPTEQDQHVTDGTKTFMKFRGMNAIGEDLTIPALGDIQTFTVTAECVSTGTEKRADGEKRPVIGMRVIEVEPGAITPAPKDEQLPFDEDDSDEDGD